MKTTELKIGDIVDYMGNAVKVTAIYNYSVIEIDNSINVYCNDVTPIKLTKEILEKNGWKKDNKEYSKENVAIEFGDNSIIIRLVDVVNDNYVMLHNISHVHELQHLLWTLGLDDKMEI